MEHHAAGLSRLIDSRGLPFIAQLRVDYCAADINDRERALLDYASKLTRTPQAMVRGDLDAMRGAGLSDRDILDANLVTAYFAYVNRIADGLGVQLDAHVATD